MSIKLKKLIFIIFILFTAYSGKSFSQIDSVAVVILDNMSDVVTNLESCSFTLRTEYDIYSTRLGLVKHSDVSDVYMKAPDKILVNRNGDMGQKDFYYDGKTFSYYSKDINIYASVPAPSTILETIDSLNDGYGLEFPAADIFYPDLIDDILENSDNLSYLGLTDIEGKECFHIAGTAKELTFQIWVTNDKLFLPAKMIIVYTRKTGNPQYQAVFQNWNLNPTLQNSMFDFTVPPDAVKISLKKKN
jgi:hypothetical protein